MCLHPEFMRLVKRELSWPLLALVLIISGLGWWNTESDFRSKLAEGTIHMNWGTEKQEKKWTSFSVDINTQEGCVRDLIAESGVENKEAENRCTWARDFIYKKHAQYFSIILSIILLIAAARVINTLHSDFKNNTWDYQRLGTHASWRLALAKILGGAALAFYGFVVNAGMFMVLARTQDVHNLGLMSGLILVVGMAAAVPFLVYAFQVTEGRPASLLLVWAVAICAASVLSQMLPISLEAIGFSTFDELSTYKAFEFAGRDFPAIPAMLLVGMIVNAVFLTGAVRLLKSYQTSVTRPWFLLASIFLLSNYVYFTEGSDRYDILDTAGGLAKYAVFYMLTALAFSYLTCILGNRSLLRYRQLEWRKAETGKIPWHLLPVWCPLLASALVAALVAAVQLLGVGKDTGLIVFILHMFGFVVRDLAILHLTTLRRPAGQGDMLGLLILFILYVMLPTLGPDALDGLFVPTAKEPAALGMGVVSAWGQAMLCLILLRGVWRRGMHTAPQLAGVMRV
jgi:hypothetical protein